MKRLLLISTLFLSLCLNAQVGAFGVIVPDASAPDTTYNTLAQFVTAISSLSVAGWQDLNNSGSAPHTVVKTGTQNGITLSTQNTAAWNVFGAATSNTTGGENDSDGGGFAFNATVQRSILFNYNDTYSGSTTDANFKISGLTANTKYVVDLLPTRETGTVRECTAKLIDRDGTTTYTTYMDGTQNVGATNPTTTGVYATGNTSKYFRMWGIANASGELFIWIGGTTNASDNFRFGISAGIRILEPTITP